MPNLYDIFIKPLGNAIFYPTPSDEEFNRSRDNFLNNYRNKPKILEVDENYLGVYQGLDEVNGYVVKPNENRKILKDYQNRVYNFHPEDGSQIYYTHATIDKVAKKPDIYNNDGSIVGSDKWKNNRKNSSRNGQPNARPTTQSAPLQQQSPAAASAANGRNRRVSINLTGHGSYNGGPVPSSSVTSRRTRADSGQGFGIAGGGVRRGSVVGGGLL